MPVRFDRINQAQRLGKTHTTNQPHICPPHRPRQHVARFARRRGCCEAVNHLGRYAVEFVD
ncbi:hypothetical protein BC937DRAFT_89492 [Endogone sp. FLAS-F59071]|nr:hypothetical protein BC937DRAFT_89492 [Endogone sp. FLAS-F59071]|eukprot:RUS22372.1 hypothetical protein BC937DRAFT_89492 [Endogone sp. FLAS-F59071]